MDYTFLPDVGAEVEVPSDGTLSRVLHRDDRLRLVAFAFDTGQELTEHTASVPAVVQVVSGRIEMTLAGDTVTMEPGAWLRMDAHLAHSLVALEPTVLILTMLPKV